MCTEKTIEELILNTKELDFAKSYHEKQMKIVKAVNELGEHPERSVCNPDCIGVSKGVGDFYEYGEFHFVTLHNESNKYWELICTISEYNQCIEEMKYHYDIPKWCSYNRADKELLSVENSDYSFYEKETFVYGQVVYVSNKPSNNGKLKFGFYHINGDSAILFNDLHLAYSVELSAISSKPIKSKEEIELEEAKKKQVHDNAFIYSHYFKSIDKAREMFLDMQGWGGLAEIILPLEKN